ncbi:MAG: hypothetical protein HUK15_04565 [Bacteroidales bacterium]|nr:hypothetical protein [Bacteroidales bacterium]
MKSILSSKSTDEIVSILKENFTSSKIEVDKNEILVYDGKIVYLIKHKTDKIKVGCATNIWHNHFLFTITILSLIVAGLLGIILCLGLVEISLHKRKKESARKLVEILN